MKKSQLIYRNGRKGFTLLEALFAVLLVAVLAAVAVPMYSNTLAQSKTDTCLNNVRAIANAETKYKFEIGSYTTTAASLLGQGLAEFPKCPAAPAVAYTLTLSGSNITVACPTHAANTMLLQ